MATKTKKTAPKMSVHRPTAKMIADAAGAKEHTVYSVQNGRRSKGAKAKKIVLAGELLEVGMNKLLEEVKRVVNF